MHHFVVSRSKYFRNRKVLGDWDIRVEQVCRPKNVLYIIYFICMLSV